MFSAPFLVTLLDRVKAIMRRVMRPAAADQGSVVGGDSLRGPVQGTPSPAPLHDAVNRWMSARLDALTTLMRRIEAGEVMDAPRRAPRGAKGEGALTALVASPAGQRLPRGFGWMCAAGPNVRRDGAAFADLLNEPVMKAMVLAAPERMARLIGPILTATGEHWPDWFQAAPKRERGSLPTCAVGPARRIYSEGSCDVPHRGSESCVITSPDPGSCGVAPARSPPTRGGRNILPSQVQTQRSIDLLANRSPPTRLSKAAFVKMRPYKPQPTLAHIVTISKQKIASRCGDGGMTIPSRLHPLLAPDEDRGVAW